MVAIGGSQANLQREVRAQWPMDNYLAAWKTFRRLSNENEALAAHLVGRPSWPSRDELVLCDIGCGNGLLAGTVVVHSPKVVGEVRLIDPDFELLREASRAVYDTACVERVHAFCARAEDRFAWYLSGADAALMVHVVYLLEESDFCKLLAQLPAGTALFIVLDSFESVFYRLWARTAPRYHARVAAAHKLLQGLSPADYTVRYTDVSARLPSPFSLTRADLRDHVLSLLCYSPTSDIERAGNFDWVAATMAEFTTEDSILCSSSCYEVSRTE